MNPGRLPTGVPVVYGGPVTATLRRLLPYAVLVAGLGGLVAGAQPELRELAKRPVNTAVDLIPVWCRARALLREDGTCGDEVLRALFPRAPLRRPEDDHTYMYPPTAAVLFTPTANLGYARVIQGWRALSALAVVGAALAPALAVAGSARATRVGVGLGMAGLFFTFRVTHGSLLAGQTGPMLAALVGLTLLGLGRRARWAELLGGAAAGLGAALKLFPLLLAPAMVRRPRVAAAAGGVLLAVGIAAAALARPGDLAEWSTNVTRFVSPPPRDAWLRQEPGWVIELWRWREWVPGAVTALVALEHLRRRREPSADTALAALLAAWGGLVLAGSQQTHEGLVLLPAAAWALCWPAQRGPGLLRWLAPLAILGAMSRFGVWSRFAPPSSLGWVPVGWGIWLVALWRWGWERRSPGEAAGRSSTGPEGARGPG